jgi:steroid 5-alpha reductase family enzyme
MTLTLLTTLLICVALFSLIWLIHVRMADASIVDYVWSPGFAVIALATALMAGAWGGHQILVIALVCLWAARLASHLIARHQRAGSEDPRYAAMRVDAGPNWWWQNLFIVFWLQAVLQWLIASPIHAALLFDRPDPAMPLFAAGVALFIFGFFIEAIADAQLARFKADPANAGGLMTTGLWSWSRHPNYFGEVVLWWGLGLAGFALSGQWWAFAGPALLMVLILKVSGVSMLDQRMASRPGFAAYAARTSAFVPMPPRSPQPKQA